MGIVLTFSGGSMPDCGAASVRILSGRAWTSLADAVWWWAAKRRWATLVMKDVTDQARAVGATGLSPADVAAWRARGPGRTKGIWPTHVRLRLQATPTRPIIG
jgi:hypothetical protein